MIVEILDFIVAMVDLGARDMTLKKNSPCIREITKSGKKRKISVTRDKLKNK